MRRMSAFANSTFRTENVVTFDSMQQARWEKARQRPSLGTGGLGNGMPDCTLFPERLSKGRHNTWPLAFAGEPGVSGAGPQSRRESGGDVLRTEVAVTYWQ